MEQENELSMNDIGRISIKTTKPLFFDSYRRNRNTGSIILVNEATNETVGAGMII
jgi:sulfate adenylyltransferase subunit 1